MQKHLEKMSEVTFEKIFNQKLGTPCLLFLVAHSNSTFRLPGLS